MALSRIGIRGNRPSAFMKVFLDHEEVGRTDIIRKADMPRWHHDITIEIPQDKSLFDCHLEVEAWDQSDKKSRFLGCATLDEIVLNSLLLL